MRLTACCLAVSLWLFLSPPSWAVVSVGQRYTDQRKHRQIYAQRKGVPGSQGHSDGQATRPTLRSPGAATGQDSATPATPKPTVPGKRKTLIVGNQFDGERPQFRAPTGRRRTGDLVSCARILRAGVGRCAEKDAQLRSATSSTPGSIHAKIRREHRLVDGKSAGELRCDQLGQREAAIRSRSIRLDPGRGSLHPDRMA